MCVGDTACSASTMHKHTHTLGYIITHTRADTFTYAHVHMQGLDKIIGTHIKLKDSLFNVEFVLLQPSVQLEIESYSFMTSSKRIVSHSSIKTCSSSFRHDGGGLWFLAYRFKTHHTFRLFMIILRSGDSSATPYILVHIYDLRIPIRKHMSGMYREALSSWMMPALSRNNAW